MQVLTVIPTFLDFGSGAPGSAGSSQYVLATVLAAATDFTASVAGEASGDYTISSSCPSSGSDPKICLVNVTFAPTASGARPASLNLSAKYTDSGTTRTPQLTVSLSGTGSASTKAIAVDPATPSTLYAGISGSGIYKSTDNAATWTAAATQPSDTRITALAVKPADTAKLFAATGGGGVFVSLDGGVNWSACADVGLDNINVSSLVVTAAGQLFAGTDAGVFTSSNDCASWTAQNSGLPQ